ncbi:MAG: hypothetical protein ACE37I_10490 [Rubinisphaera brasiliensis]|uniref:hypothetical protein n=1 Tax=Rubinisphaera brasiliensis TaxID=119 RepID=UPI00391CF41D
MVYAKDRGRKAEHCKYSYDKWAKLPPYERGYAPDEYTLLRDVPSYLAECRTLIAMGDKPFKPVTLDQHYEAWQAELIEYAPARGELDWQRFHRPKPFVKRYVEKLCATMMSNPEFALAFRAACRTGGR